MSRLVERLRGPPVLPLLVELEARGVVRLTRKLID
jgi:hypothetical protein